MLVVRKGIESKVQQMLIGALSEGSKTILCTTSSEWEEIAKEAIRLVSAGGSEGEAWRRQD